MSERPHPIRGLLVANEWLDNVPLDVAVDGRYVEVDVTGEERSGSVLDDADATWVAQWWPGAEPGDRAEIGRTRDTAWADAVAGVERGLAVAVDYGHTLEERAAGGYSGGTLTGFRGGRGVLAIPDGSCDITAHVALDSLGGTLVRQRDALRALGVNAQRPELVLAESDPRAYLAALQQAGEAAELTAIGGLGDFGWVLCPVGIDVPDLIGSLRP